MTLEPKAALDAVEEALAGGAEGAAAAANDHGLDSTFTSQTDSGEVDVNMLKYIEEQMHGGGGAGGSGAEGEKRVLDAEEAELYTTPAHLLGVVPGGGTASNRQRKHGVARLPLSYRSQAYAPVPCGKIVNAIPVVPTAAP